MPRTLALPRGEQQVQWGVQRRWGGLAGRVLSTEGLAEGRVGGGGWHRAALHFQ